MKQVDFENGSLTGNILRTALPMMAAQAVALLYNIVDRIYIGRIPGVGTLALGSVGLCFPIIIFIQAFSSLYMGGAPLASISLGRRDVRRAEKILNTAFFMTFFTALLLTLAIEGAAGPLLRLLGASTESLPYALPYLRIYLTGTLFIMASSALNPYITAQGFPSTAMLTVVIGAVANLVLDPLFMFVLGFGIRGAAAATVLSQALSAAFALRFLLGKKALLRLRLLSPSAFLQGGDLALDIVSLGTAGFIMQATNCAVSVVCNQVLSGFGDIYISVYTVVSSIRQMLDTPVLALGEGASPVISYNYGADRPARVRGSVLIMTAIGVSYTLLTWLLVLVAPRFFIGIFSSDPSLMEPAVRALHLYFFAFVFQALQISGQTTFKALNKKKQAIFFSLFRKVVIVVPLTLLLPRLFGLGPAGVFMAEPISNFVGGMASFTTMYLTVLPGRRSA